MINKRKLICYAIGIFIAGITFSFLPNIIQARIDNLLASGMVLLFIGLSVKWTKQSTKYGTSLAHVALNPIIIRLPGRVLYWVVPNAGLF